jgi:hypothetical protein
MSFVYPSFLIAFTALSIPIIVHLFNFRRYKKVYFTNVKFLKEVQQESKAKSTLKRLLILASRLLALSCLILAFAQPYLPGDHSIKKGVRLLSVYIDNSYSMQAVNKSGNLLEDAKRKARELAQATSAGGKFQLLTNDFSSSQLTLSKEQMLDAIDRVQLSPAVRAASEVYARMHSNLRQNEKGAEYFLFTDFQKSAFNASEFKPDSLAETNFVFLENPQAQNVFIDSCYVESPYFQLGSLQKLHVRIRNLSEREIDNGSLKFFLNKKQVTPLSFKAAPGAVTDAQLSFTCRDTGVQNGVLALEDFPVTFDDTLYFSFRVNNRIPCLVINKKEEAQDLQGPGARLRSLFSNDSTFSYREQNDQAVDFSAFAKSNLIIVNSLKNISSGLSAELKKYILSGGSALVFPDRNADLNSYNNFFLQMGSGTLGAADTGRVRLENRGLPKSFYEGVYEKIPENMDMPLAGYRYNLQSSTRSGEEVLLKLVNGQPFLSLYNKGKGKLYICASPPDEKSSSFIRHSLFVTTLIKMAILSRPSPPLYYYSGSNEAIDVSLLNTTGEKPLHISSGKTDFIPELKTTETSRYILTHGQPGLAGNYSLMHDKNILEGLSFNYKRKESDLACYTHAELEDIIQKAQWKHVSLLETNAAGFKNSLADISGGTKLWKLFILLTLLFLLAETALIKFMK